VKSTQDVGGTAIIGFGATDVTRQPTEAIGQYAVRAVKAALETAGIDKDEVDGYVGAPGLASYSTNHWDGADEVSAEYMLSALGLKPRWSADTSGLVLGMVAAARGALLTGMCQYVVGVRALYYRSGSVYSSVSSSAIGGSEQFTMPYGFGPGGARHAQWLARYNSVNGATREDLFAIVKAAHTHARLNPRAYWKHSTLTLDEYLESRWVVEPLCLYDCDIPVTGAAAFVMTTTEAAKALGVPFATVTSMSNGYHPRGALDDAGLVASDIQVCQLYDGFASFPYFWYEALGFCPDGTAHRFIQDGTIELGGTIPTNTFGGSLGEGRLHGIGHLHEAYLQVTDQAGARQVPNVEHGVVQVGAPDRSWIAVVSRGN
jgi:acetyl-CoA acetyltransferase